MTALNKQALREAAQEEIMLRSVSDTSDAWQDEASPEAVLALLDELEAKDVALSSNDYHFDQNADRIKSLEKALEAAEKRIAELEARKPVMFIDGDISPADADKLASVIREFNEETETPAARMARIIRENPRPTNMCDMPAAGIGVKGE